MERRASQQIVSLQFQVNTHPTVTYASIHGEDDVNSGHMLVQELDKGVRRMEERKQRERRAYSKMFG